MAQSFKEVAHLRGNKKLFDDGYDRIFGKKKESEMDIENKASKYMEKKYGRDAFNPCHGAYTAGQVHTAYVEGLVATNPELEAKIKELEEKLKMATEALEYASNKTSDSLVEEIVDEALEKIKAL